MALQNLIGAGHIANLMRTDMRFGVGITSHMQQSAENKKFGKIMPSAQRQLLTVSEAEEPNGSCPILAGSENIIIDNMLL